MNNRKKNTANLLRFKRDIIVSDANFVPINPGKKQWTGDVKSAIDAFYLSTERGWRFSSKDVDSWEEFKALVIAHNNMAMTVAMWKEDIYTGILKCEELASDGFVEFAIAFSKQADEKDNAVGKWWLKEDHEQPAFKGDTTIAANNRFFWKEQVK